MKKACDVGGYSVSAEVVGRGTPGVVLPAAVTAAVREILEQLRRPAA